MEKLLQTPSQTVGPFFAYGLAPEQYLYDFKTVHADNCSIDGTNQSHFGNTIRLWGQVLDGEGKPIPDALVELWLNDREQQFFARCGTGTDPQCRFFFQAPKPKPLNGQAPFYTLIVFMRGQLIHSFTRVYFSDEAALNEKDEVLNAVPAERRNTLIAQKKDTAYVFDIRMQGEGETVFFDI
jgi:protocatechuate 3,4-dioxygenase alpha subunit